ncbi:nucleoside triphosphate pyrophosphohydrolase [Paramagnetospirillum kuznetsovii]|uniref:Nucleoside triphosphate pyrophosphohydrolase n=1 Tax=Paramagnetospirillum kuznetsovii TaxID=2053833 RepID=A0A364NZR4_9PROT|nr:nucleoside triphosphate pyrophosphohydrolase [Paramagnetospirillum kuznetsovii]RAU22543.1 nucleoside triphosphate pyrophosphohydrolase [Paramagnetospirillum kuznetsovii]
MRSIDRLLDIMARLRDPKAGCPWDLEQSFATIAPYTIEEAYEVAEAIDQGDMPALKDELGDLLFQVVFYAQMAKENGDFDFDAIAEAIADKMIRRHPHVFGQPDGRDSAGQTIAWEETKARERTAKSEEAPGVLAGIARTLPPMTRALKLQKRAARVGFDWAEAVTILDKLAEEAAEIAHEIKTGAPHDRLEDEMGDVLFVCVNLARKLDIDPERALKRANAKFERRFGHIETELKAQGRSPERASLDEMEALWQAAKVLEKSGGSGDR